MSLIADALKAAQEEKSRQGSPDRAAARRFLSSSVTVGGRRGEAVKWDAPESGGIPRPVRIAAVVFALATIGAVAFVVLAPGDDPRSGVEVASLNPAVEEPTPADGEPAGTAAEAEPEPEPSGALAYEEEGDFDEPEPEPMAAAPAPARSAPARGERAPAAAESRPAPMAATQPGRPADPGPLPATEVAADAGRFQLRLQPTREPGVSNAFQQALAAQRRRDYPAAIQLYERALLSEPSNAEALNNLGATYQAAGNLAGARDAFRRALAANPGFAAAWSNLAVVLGSLGETVEAQAALAEAIRLDPANHGAKVNLALQYQRQGLVPQARRLLEEVVQTAPQMAEAHYALGRLLEEQGDGAAAVRHYKLFLSTGAGRFAQLDPMVRQRVIQLGGNPDAR